ncbi:uncharacterized protein ACIQIH_017573 isoform 2-T2 [Cyanocitta cristata]
MEQPSKPSPEQMRPPTSSDSFSSRFLGQVLQLSFVKYPLKLLQKASTCTGLVFPVEAIRSKLRPPSQSPTRPGLLARKRRGKLLRLLLSVTPTSIQNFLGYLPTDWGQSNVSKEIREALISPASKASKRKRDDVALEKQESWLVVLERDFPEDDSEDRTYEDFPPNFMRSKATEMHWFKVHWSRAEQPAARSPNLGSREPIRDGHRDFFIPIDLGTQFPTWIPIGSKSPCP